MTQDMQEQKTILDEIYNYVGKFVVFPNEHSKVAYTAWVAHTHLTEVFYTTPRLHILSAVKGCGKTTLLNVTELLVKDALSIVNPSPASLYTLIEQKHPTLLLDEIDRLFAKKDTSDITAIINSGFQKGAKVPRVSVEPRRSVEYFDVFGPMALVGIDKSNMPDTIADRSIPIRLKRRMSIEQVEPFRPRTKGAEGHVIREKLAAWAEAVSDRAQTLDSPSFPSEIEGRNQDKWEALFIVADVTDDTANTDVTAHPRWGERIRQAALAYLAEEREAEPPSYGELILRDLHSVFHDFRSEPRLKTTALLDRLSAIEESPWYAYEHGKPLSAMGLARLLKPYGIRPTTIRFSPQDEAKGYYKSDFEDAWSRYLGSIVPPGKVVTPVTLVTPVTTDGNVSALAFSKGNAEKQPRCLW